MDLKDKKQRILHNPNLRSIKMVEDALKGHSGECTKYQLWRKLPKSMMYQTYSVILNYLTESEKIRTNKDGKIVWVFYINFSRRALERDNIMSSGKHQWASI